MFFFICHGIIYAVVHFVPRHLIKLYDSMAQLKFLNDKIAMGMYSKDGEYVEFHGNCECSGQVNNNNKNNNIIFIIV